MADRVRRSGLALVMVGALSVSVRGQVQAVEPLLGGMSVVLALTNDLAALLALNELMSTQRRAVRRWAWAVLVLAGGTAAGLNTWHALEAGELPPLGRWSSGSARCCWPSCCRTSSRSCWTTHRSSRSSRRPGDSGAPVRRYRPSGRQPTGAGHRDRLAPAPVRARENESSRAAQVPTRP